MHSRLYRNEGQWEFTNVTESVLQNRLGAGLNGAWADFDNDGDLDLYFMGYESGPDRFLLNNGDGTFADWDGQPSSLLQVGNGMPVWGDYDNDGFLDLLITGPDHCRLFRHSGDGSFVEVTAVTPSPILPTLNRLPGPTTTTTATWTSSWPGRGQSQLPLPEQRQCQSLVEGPPQGDKLPTATASGQRFSPGRLKASWRVRCGRSRRNP
jgi:hypothetical protein